MKHLKQYIFLTYSQTFFPIFSILYIVTSIVYLVKIASLTSVIQINFLELLEMYAYTIPNILYYTMPISVFVALALTLTKLSSEYELIVITSFGLNPIKLIKIIFFHLVLLTVFLLINSLALVPKASTMNQAFIEKKKTEAKFNIKASEYGQQFAQWLIYVDKEKNGLYKDVVLFKNDNKEDTIVIAKTATLNNEGTNLSLNLSNGKVIRANDQVNQVNFKKMTINNTIETIADIKNLNDLFLYWSDIDKDKKKMYKFSFSILSSLFPIISILFIIAIGYYNPRYDKNRTTAISVILVLLYMIIAQKLSNKYAVSALTLFPLLWIGASIITYRKKILNYY
ncbi:MAG: LptF/LptG family permease [Campylobacterota bacterium]|nr:LptF/LptG family permease [Campylobacterota bacterium]